MWAARPEAETTVFTLDAVWETYGARMFAEAQRLLGEPDDSEAACMHVLLRAADHLSDPIDARANLWPWLRRLTHAVCDEVVAGGIERGARPAGFERVRRALMHQAVTHGAPPPGDEDSIAGIIWRARQRIRERIGIDLGEFPAVVALTAASRRFLDRVGRRAGQVNGTPASQGWSGYLAANPLVVEAAVAVTAAVSLAMPGAAVAGVGSTGEAPRSAPAVDRPSETPTVAEAKASTDEPLRRLAESGGAVGPAPDAEP
ncbi:MAG TPA: hypothetical protein VM618_03020, partial [Acidimicrobiia bacterium]|nr:hypothetical protein [Acidimicrobiia bacterium]